MITLTALPDPSPGRLAGLVPLPAAVPGFDPDDARALAADFFRWLEEDWRLPVVRPDLGAGGASLDDHVPFAPDPAGRYTLGDLVAATGIAERSLRAALRAHGVRRAGTRPRRGATGGVSSGSPFKLYDGGDLAALAESWDRERLQVAMDTLWDRFVPAPCGMCRNCVPVRNRYHCVAVPDAFVPRARASLIGLIDGVRAHGGLAAWWRLEGLPAALGPAPRARRHDKSGLIVLYLLDRRLIVLPAEAPWRVTFHDLLDDDLLRPWRNRRPEEAATFERVLARAGQAESTREHVRKALALFVLLAHGLPGLAELGRPLGSDAARHAARQGRLVTRHVSGGVFLPRPLTDDIRVGHLILDDLRHAFWSFAAEWTARDGAARWGRGPLGWTISDVGTLEMILTAEVWAGDLGVLPRRPDVAGALINPHRVRRDAERAGTAPWLLPPALRRAVEDHVAHRFEERGIQLRTLKSELAGILSFLGFARERGDLDTYWTWGPRAFADVFGRYVAERLDGWQPTSLHGRLSHLLVFFDTLAQLDRDPPQPLGYGHALKALLPRLRPKARRVPREGLFDRLFRDGVCRLDHDPFSRLALTILYYCGTRESETCELHLFCVLEDADGVRLLVPIGKSGAERAFPIVAEGMEPLIRFMDEVVASQLETVETPTGPRHRPKGQPTTNHRYLDTDPDKATAWRYLFDRSSDARRDRKRRGHLGPSRIRLALQEALILAAMADPAGFFRAGTWSPNCRWRRRKGVRCHYYSARDGVVTCPLCGATLAGRRGTVCNHVLTADLACDGRGAPGDWFCPRCDAPLAEFIAIVPHMFRHNSVSRAHRRGVSLEANMALHGHQTVPMHLRYLHLLPADQEAEVRRVFEEERFRDIRLIATDVPGRLVVDGVPHTPTAEELARYALVRGLARRTHGLWGGFWVGALAEDGATGRSGEVGGGGEIVVTEDTYHHAVAQYRWQALALAVSAVALARGVPGKYAAEVPDFLDGRAIESLVAQHLTHVREHLASPLYVRLMARDVEEQRAFLRRLEELLRPWWEPQGGIGALVRAFVPEDVDAFQAP